MNKKILITGITGFAGSHLADSLLKADKYEISGTHLSDRNLNNINHIKESVTLFQVDLLNLEKVKEVFSIVRPDIIFHLAASTSVADSFKNPSAVLTNNITSQVNILEAAIATKLQLQKILIISSSHVYGNVGLHTLPIDEKVDFRPDNPYSVSKIAQDYLGLSYYLAYKLPIVRLRPFNHIGPRLSPKISISYFAKSIALIEKGLQIPILKVGNLEAKRDFTDVRDMVQAYILAADKCLSGEAYNIGSNKTFSIKQMLDKLLSKAKNEIEIQTDKSLLRPSDIPELRADPTKFQKITDWKPQIDIDQTISDLLDYWREVV